MNVTRRRRERSAGRHEDEGEDAGLMQAIMDSLMGMAGAGAAGDGAAQGAGGGMMAGLAGRLRAMLGGGGGAEDGQEVRPRICQRALLCPLLTSDHLFALQIDDDERQAMLAQIMELAEETRATRAGGPLPGGFPADDDDDDDDDQYEDESDYSDR
jgi:hypothetical protein